MTTLFFNMPDPTTDDGSKSFEDSLRERRAHAYAFGRKQVEALQAEDKVVLIRSAGGRPRRVEARINQVVVNAAVQEHRPGWRRYDIHFIGERETPFEPPGFKFPRSGAKIETQ